MMGVKPQDSDPDDFVEVDPTGRYGRYNEILGKGASKTVYRGFDEYEGIEVAWNQVKLNDFLRSPEDMERLYCEIHLLKTLKHKNIMKFYTSWVDISNRNINFVTELFTSGTLRQYRQKHKRVHMRAVKHWCRQILRGLLYLHCHDPPIIHRDLKCDNIFINGNRGVVKIGDLGLAAILRKSHAAHCVGTPEFMAPEVYEEDYNELVDIYSFGMCILEMVTFEYPYSECTHPAQIYKKVISGSKPEALSRVEDVEVKRFVEKCLATASQRLSARELLEDPFLRIDEQGSGSWEGDISKMCQILRQPSYGLLHMNGSLIANGFSDDLRHESRAENGWDYEAPEVCHMAIQSSHRLLHCRGSLITNWLGGDHLHEINTENGWDYNASDFETHGIDLFNGHEDEHLANVDITIKGRMREDGCIFLRLRITDYEGRVRNIYFPFDIESDTAFGVATEMVGELDITDHDVTRIAEMIEGEVSSLVHELKPGPGPEEMLSFSPTAFCHNCASNVSSCGSLLLQSAHCSGLDCAAMHGRFEEITYHVEGSEQYVDEEATELSTGHSQVLVLSSKASTDEEGGQFDRSSICEKQTIEAFESNISDDYGNSIHQELRWLKSKHRMELRDHGNRELEERRDSNSPPYFDNRKSRVENQVAGTPLQASSEKPMKPLHSGKQFSFRIPPRRNLLQTSTVIVAARSPRQCEPNPGGSSRNMVTAESFYGGSICKTKSLPVDAVGSYMD